MMLLSSSKDLWWLKAFIIVNIIDAITTFRALSYEGVSEGHPIYSIGFSTVGIETTLVLKVLLAVVLGLVLVKFNRGHLLKWPTLVILLVAISNSFQQFFV